MANTNGNKGKTYFYMRTKAYKFDLSKPYDNERLTPSDIKRDKMIGSPVFYEHDRNMDKKVGEIVDYIIDKDGWLILSVIIDYSFGDTKLKKKAIKEVRKGKIEAFSIAYSFSLSGGNRKLKKTWLEASLTSDPDIEGAGGRSKIIMCHNNENTEDVQLIMPLESATINEENVNSERNDPNNNEKEKNHIYISQDIHSTSSEFLKLIYIYLSHYNNKVQILI